jgi:hypothetical protein
MRKNSKIFALTWLAPVLLVTTIDSMAKGDTAQTAMQITQRITSNKNHEVFMPPNILHLRQTTLNSNIDEATFNAIIDRAYDFYQPIVSSYGATLEIMRGWEYDDVNALAGRSGDIWTVIMFGGLARAPEVTADGFALVICHEMGHHLGGYPFSAGATWSGSEGQSDYFATHSCARQMWRDDDNTGFGEHVHPTAKTHCDAEWNHQSERDLCYRVSFAAQSLGDLLGSLEGATASYDTPDETRVSMTRKSHPNAQCRLDTYLAGSLCKVEPNPYQIPGINALIDIDSIYAEQESALQQCSRASHDLSVYGVHDIYRPRCWFRPSLTSRDIAIPVNN